MSFDDKPLSPGCMACKTGSWLCVFVGTQCNCVCPHCPNPDVNAEIDKMTAAGFGEVDTDKITEILNANIFKGVGISGGEPMLYIDKVVELIRGIKEDFPHLYVWTYTNGVLATETNLNRLKEVGLDEIRFDLAADNYSPIVLANMERATRLIPSVGIEVPVMVEQYSDLVKAIDFAESVGVKYLNLHDLFVNDTLFKNGLGGYMRAYDPISGIQRDIINSTSLIYRIFRYIKDNNFNMIPNDCTLINMQMQHVGTKYMQGMYEKLFDTDFETYMEAVLSMTAEENLLIEK